MAADMGSCNPAVLHDFQIPAIGLSGEFESKIDPVWIAGILYKKGLPFLPQSIGLVVPVGKWWFGAGFSQR
jgi:hypothetical protein